MKYFIVFVLIGCLALNIEAYPSRRERDDRSDMELENRSHEKNGNRADRRKWNSDRDDRQLSREAGSSEHVKSLAIGVNPGTNTDGKKHAGIEKLIKVVKEVMKNAKTEPLFRSKKFDFDGSTKQRDKSSAGFELDTPTVLNWVNKVISSRKFKKLTDEWARKAAVVFRALKEN